MMREKQVARFMGNVYPEPNSGCWLWDGSVCAAGYGKYGKRTRLAHRVSYEHHIGPIPVGILVCHKCDVPACVNPAHLFLGTQLDNMRDKIAKGRQAKRPIGLYWSARHPHETIEMILALRANGMRVTDIARAIGDISHQHVSKILAGKLRSVY